MSSFAEGGSFYPSPEWRAFIERIESLDNFNLAWEGPPDDRPGRVFRFNEIEIEVSFEIQLGPGSIPMLAMLGMIPRNQG